MIGALPHYTDDWLNSRNPMGFERVHSRPGINMMFIPWNPMFDGFQLPQSVTTKHVNPQWIGLPPK